MSASNPRKPYESPPENLDPIFKRPEILLHPNIPKPMHGIAPRTVMGKEWWDRERQITYKQNNYCCWACGIHKTQALFHQWLEAHEFFQMDYPNGKMIFVETVALCNACHNFIHSGRMEAMVDQGAMSEDKQQLILKRGKAIVKGLPKPKSPTDIAKWSEWRLVFGGAEYQGSFKTFEDWKNHYRK